MSEWELLKENVEPIKSGRSVKTLKKALNEKPNEMTEREEKRKQFESDLRTYEGSDLLSVYYEYIVWVEQNYPLGGNEVNFKTLLEKCIEQFYSTDDYRNDERLLEVFLKLIKRVDSPLELFAFFNDNGFALELADFYINWAFHLENSKNCRKAGDILRLGLLQNAEPRSRLEDALEQLENRVAKAIVNDRAEEVNEEIQLPQRQPLNNLKAKSKAPVKRVGNAVTKTNKGLKVSTKVQPSDQNKVTEVYCDENDPNVEAIVKQPEPPATKPPIVKAIASIGQENERKPGKWSENALTQKSVSKTNIEPKFEIHYDNSDGEDEPVRKPPQSNTLKVRARNADSPPIARFEKPDPFKKYAFNMNKLYAGTEEFSFEEIRGKKWLARKKREEEALRNRKLEEEVEQLKRQIELLLKSQQMVQQISQPVPSAKSKERTTSPVPSSADSSVAKSGTDSNGNGTNTQLSMMRELWNGTLANATADDMNPRLDINAVIDKNEERIHKNKETPFAIYADTSIYPKKDDLKPKPRESTGFNDYTLALPRSEETFFAKASHFSTPVVGKAKRSVIQTATNAEPPTQPNYNFVGGMTAKLTPIVETSREYNSRSSSSSGTRTTMSSTGRSGSSSGRSLSRKQRP